MNLKRKLWLAQHRADVYKYGTILSLLIIVTISIIYYTYSKFTSKNEMTVYETTVEPFIKNDYFLASYIDGEWSDSITGKNDGYVVDKVVCDNGAIGTWDNETWSININNATKKIKCNVYFKTIFKFDFDYTGTEQIFNVPETGTYKIETWGAQGGSYNDEYHGGYGGYSSGIIELTQNTLLYVYVGGTNICKEGTLGRIDFGYNGGGAAGGENWPNRNFCGGGGATDIRIENASWDNFDSLKSRIMVAAGGGGANWYTEYYSAIGGAAGGLVSYIGKTNANDPTTGSVAPTIYPSSQTSGPYFGKGVNEVTAGGGGGYYGGNSASWTGGAGGSSFISGHKGCDAIKEESTENNIIHTEQSIHYSGLYFTNTLMIDGEGYKWTDKKEEQIGMPSHSDNSVIMGNSGNGYARITYIE